MRCTLLTFAALLAMAASAAHAQNIVGNPGFETGTPSTFPPWTSTSSGGETTQDNLSPGNAHTGTHFGQFTYGGSPSGSGTISQTLTTVGGTTYLLDFWAKDVNTNMIGGADSLTVDWNGAALPIFLLPNDQTYHEYTMDVAATSASTVLSFNSPVMSGPTNWNINIDDVSVSGINPQTPEPGSLALLAASSLSGAAFLVRRRRQTRKNA